MLSRIIFPLAIVLLNSVQSFAASVKLDTVVMQLRSKVDADNDELLAKMLEFTAGYMDDYFGAYYINTQPENYFSYTGLEVNSFGIHGVTGSFITTLEFDGVLFFTSDPAPSRDFIKSLLENAFQGMNFQFFLDGLLASDIQFLTELTHMIIDIGGATLIEKDLENSGEATQEEEETPSSAFDLNDWSEIAIYATAGVVGALLIMSLFCAVRCICAKRRRQVKDDIEPVKLKSIEIPTGLTQAQPRQAYIPKHSRPLRKGNTDNFFNSRDRSPSPVRSIASQDSSKFTYNPAGTSMMSKVSLFSVGSLSNIDMQSVDLEAWQRNDAISSLAPAPFGNDISAIEQKERDLSLIEEEDEEDPRAVERRQYISRKARTEFEARKFRSGRQTQLSNHRRGKSAPKTNRVIDYSTEDSSTAETDSSSDVINDLRNLSRQIETHRRSNSRR
jgi:hypothetical protein